MTKLRLVCRLRIHWPRRVGRDIKDRRVYACRYCDVMMV